MKPQTVCLRVWMLVLGALILVGCGLAPAAGPAPAASTPSAASQPVALTYAFPDDEASAATATDLIKAYAAAHPNVQITARPLPAQDYAQQLLGQLDQGGPDIFVSGDTQAPALIKRKALRDLQPLLTAAQIKPDDFHPAALNAWRQGSALYGLPADAVPQVMFYNRDLFDASGVAYPAPGWSWNDWLASAKKLTVASGGQVSRFGTVLAGWSLMVWGNGGELINPEGTRTLLDRPEAVAGVQFAADMVNVHHVAPPPQDAGGPDPVELFKQQRAAMLPAPSGLAQSLLGANLPFKWGIAMLPAGPVPVSPLSVTGLAVSARSSHADEALAFAAWSVGPEGSAILASHQPFAAPALRSATLKQDQVPGVDAIGRSLEHGRTLPAVTQWPAIATVVNEALVPVWQGKTSAANAYAFAAPKINSLLATG